MSKKAKELRALRRWLGLTQDDLKLKRSEASSQLTSRTAVSWQAAISQQAAVKQQIPASHAKRVSHIKQVEDYYIDAYTPQSSTAEDQALQELRELLFSPLAAIERTFKPGACYQVFKNEKRKWRSNNLPGNDGEAGYTFRYLRKEGIHHVFQEVKDGWLRTYTDAQLVGKYVDEVRIQDILIPVKGGYVYAYM